VRELAKTREEQQWLMAAYCLGGYVSIADLLMNFMSGQDIGDNLRYSANNLDANDLGLTLAIGIPMAWHLFLDRGRLLRIHGAIYVPLAVVAILLTASRGAFLAGLVALSIIPMTLPRRSFRSATLGAAVVIAAAGLVAFIVPESSWTRVFTATEVVTGGKMSGRVQIWESGLRAFQERQVLGAGAGAFETAVAPWGQREASHNVFIAVLVEQGILGGFIFSALLMACAFCVWRLPALERKIYATIGITWLVGAMSLSWQYRKTTWLIFGLISAQSMVSSARARPQSRHFRAESDVHGRAVRTLQGDHPLLPQRASR
jgi:O-antigen ligase